MRLAITGVIKNIGQTILKYALHQKDVSHFYDKENHFRLNRVKR